ncbi:ABC transporter C-terminal domain-containing protein [Evansella sp. AB-rgal1]|uniref:ABC transporter C-terminal domain-containing protein n=1 Tax=Evansella sp. AB-rgal1 TaxID=3242696 RepID=UPI00359D367E
MVVLTITFTYDSRLGISVPQLETEWNYLNPQTQTAIFDKWEEIRGDIPDRIKDLEQEINELQQQLYEEDEFQKSCELNSSIAELASIINDLWIWYRSGEGVEVKVHS